LVQTLKEVFALDPPPDEVLVVDQTNGHEPETERFLADSSAQGLIRLIQQQPPNLTLARNRAWRETRCEILLFIDDDVLLPGDFIARHLRNYEDPAIQAVAGGVTQDGVQLPRQPANGRWPRKKDWYYFWIHSPTTPRTVGVATASGCNHSMRREALEKIGGYDPHYIGSAHFEDYDWAIRLWKSGHQIVFDPEARLEHLATAFGGTRRKKEQKPAQAWVNPYLLNYFAFRFYFPSLYFAWLVLREFRGTVLTRKNILRPWRIPIDFYAFAYSFLKAFQAARKAAPDPSQPWRIDALHAMEES
jgi:GT2 family glycosyltransferase